MKVIVIILAILTVVLLIALRLYVIWWDKQPYILNSKATKRHSRIHGVLKCSFDASATLLVIALIVWCIMWVWSNADQVILVI